MSFTLRLFTASLFFFSAVVIPGAVVHADDVSTTTLDSLDESTGWSTDSPLAISILTDPTDKQEGEGSLKLSITPSDGGGIARVYHSLPKPVDWSPYISLGLWIRPTIAVASGTLAVDVSSLPSIPMGSSTISYPLSSLTSNEWTQVFLSLENRGIGLHEVSSYGFELPLSALANITIDALTGTQSMVAATTTQEVPVPIAQGAKTTMHEIYGSTPMSSNAIRILPASSLKTLVVASAMPVVQTESSSTTSACPYFSRNLSLGLRSVQVKIVQIFLMARGFMPQQVPTTYFGKVTALGVKKFQAAYLASLPAGSAVKSSIRATGNWTIATYHSANQLLGCK